MREDHRQKTVGRYRLPEAIDAFFEVSSLKASTLETYRFYSRATRRLLGDLYLDEIDRKMLGKFIAIRKRTGVTNATIRRDLMFLGSVFTAAIRRGWADTSPVTALNRKALKESRSRILFITRDEFVCLHDVASDTLKPILVLAVETSKLRSKIRSIFAPRFLSVANGISRIARRDGVPGRRCGEGSVHRKFGGSGVGFRDARRDGR